MKKLSAFVSVILIFSWTLAACAPSPTAAPTTSVDVNAPATVPTQAPAKSNSLLDDVLKRGTLVVSTDPAYPPQSQLVENAKRATNTKCTSEQHTANELAGFDIDVAVAIAKELGVEPCFFTPDWTLITSGNWAGRWDLSIGSMTITPERMQNLYFTQPYYTTPAAFFVNKDNTSYKTPADLAGKKIGGATGTTYDAYLQHKLTIPGETINYPFPAQDIVGYETDLNALQDLALGDGVRLDAVLTAEPTGQGAIKDGLAIKELGSPVFFEYLAGALDKKSQVDPIPLAKKVSEIIIKLHSDGTLQQFSQKHYGMDLSSAAAKFDLTALNQWK